MTLALDIERLLAREPDVVLVRLDAVDDYVDFDVIVQDRHWELHALPEAFASTGRQLAAWIGGNLVPIGPIRDATRSLAARLTPVRVYVDGLPLPIGNRVCCDEYDHVVPAEIHDGRVYAHGIIVDVQPDEGTADVILLP